MTSDGRLLVAGAAGVMAAAALLSRGRLTAGSWNRMSRLQQALVKNMNQYAHTPETAIRAADLVVSAFSGNPGFEGSFGESKAALVAVIQDAQMGETLADYAKILRAQIVSNEHFTSTDLAMVGQDGSTRKTKFDKLVPWIFKEVHRLVKAAEAGKLKVGDTAPRTDRFGNKLSAQEVVVIDRVTEWSRALGNMADFVEGDPRLGYKKRQRPRRLPDGTFTPNVPAEAVVPLMEHTFGQIKYRSNAWHRRIAEEARRRAEAQAQQRRVELRKRYQEVLRGLPTDEWTLLRGTIEHPDHPEAAWALKRLISKEDFAEESLLGHCIDSGQGYYNRTQQGTEQHIGVRYQGEPRFTIHLQMPTERSPDLKLQQFVGNIKGPIQKGESNSGFHRGNNPPPYEAADIVIEAVQVLFPGQEVGRLLGHHHLSNARRRHQEVLGEVGRLRGALHQRGKAQNLDPRALERISWPEVVAELKKLQVAHKPMLVADLLAAMGKPQSAKAQYQRRSYPQIQQLLRDARRQGR